MVEKKYREKIGVSLFHYFRVLKPSVEAEDISVSVEDILICMCNSGINANDGLQAY